MRKAFLLGAVGFAVVLAMTRWALTSRAIPSESLHFRLTHDVNWDAAARLLTRTGSDPFFVVDLPADVAPARSVIFEFGGSYLSGEGTFYVSAMEGSSFGPMVTGRASSFSDGYQIRANLPDADAVRLDLQDFLPRPLEFRRIIVHRPFASASSGVFLLLLGSVAIAAGLSAWSWLDRPRRPAGHGRPAEIPASAGGSR